MKIFRFVTFTFLIYSLTGCYQSQENSMTLSFWTDRELDEDYKMVYANEKLLGELNEGLSNPICDDPLLINLEIYKAEDLNISIRNTEGDAIELGLVNLYSISTGIKIKPNENSDIFVDRSLDDICTLIYLNWD